MVEGKYLLEVFKVAEYIARSNPLLGKVEIHGRHGGAPEVNNFARPVDHGEFPTAGRRDGHIIAVHRAGKLFPGGQQPRDGPVMPVCGHLPHPVVLQVRQPMPVIIRIQRLQPIAPCLSPPLTPWLNFW